MGPQYWQVLTLKLGLGHKEGKTVTLFSTSSFSETFVNRILSSFMLSNLRELGKQRIRHFALYDILR